VINVIFLQKFLHVNVAKLLPYIGLQVFRMSTALSNYLDDSVNHFAFTFILKQYGLRVLAQHIDDDKYVVVAVVEHEYGRISR